MELPDTLVIVGAFGAVVSFGSAGVLPAVCALTLPAAYVAVAVISAFGPTEPGRVTL
ncbi:hypothetical protein [Lactococcus petauri]|uniref:hypothetical protein n=1 Tax=Lactococcus petauri TaxID=1940789 RepID=UPI003D31CA38